MADYTRAIPNIVMPGVVTGSRQATGPIQPFVYPTNTRWRDPVTGPRPVPPTTPGRWPATPSPENPITPFNPNAPRIPVYGPPNSPTPDVPDHEKTGGPSEQPLPTAGNFSKGQVYPDLLPNGQWSPQAGDFYSSEGFNAYRGANQGFGPRGRASGYDPYGIGQENYGGGSYDSAPGSAKNIYGLTGVNSMSGYTGPERYGVVGGNGGYGFGMVNPEYSGPLFDNATGALKAMRRQNRLLNKPTQAIYSGPPVESAGGAGTAGQPGKTGQPATTPAVNTQTAQQQPGKTGQPAASAGQTQGYNIGGTTWTRAPGGSFHFTDGKGRYMTAEPNNFRAQIDGQWLDLVQSSGNNNLYKVNGGGEQNSYHYVPGQGWQRWSGDPNQQLFNIGDAANNIRDAAGQVYDGWDASGKAALYTVGQNGFNQFQQNATAQWDPNPMVVKRGDPNSRANWHALMRR